VLYLTVLIVYQYAGQAVLI